MTLEASFRELYHRLKALGAALEEGLLWAIIEGKPAQEDHVLVGRYDDAATDLLGLVEEAKTAAQEAQEAVENQRDLSGARRALIKCQTHINDSSNRFFSELISFEALGDLENLAKEKQESWPQWVIGLRDALEHCRQPLEDVNQALFLCWQELTEEAVSLSVPLQCSMRPDEQRVSNENKKPE